MRVNNSIKNMFFGLSGQVISMVMGLIVRTVFIYTLGIEYLGIDGLFTSILLMLSLANLGFDTAMIYSLYKPLEEKDHYKIQALMNLYKKAYRIIGFIVLIIGLSLLPFLSFIITEDTKIDNLNIIYLLFLLQSVLSYNFVYKQSILIADQKNHIISKIHSMFIIVSNFSLIFFLLTTENYIVVLSVQVGFRLIENAYISKKATNLYPYIKEKSNASLSKKDKKIFYENLYSLFLYKISGVVINGTDNIIISVFAGIALVGIYSNYLLIITTVTTFIGYIFYSITASVGNLNVSENKEKKYFIFRVINFANFWVYGFCTVCLWNLINPFINLWLGEQYLMNMLIVFTILLNFYTAGMQNATTTFRETTGLFKKGKYRPIYAAIINLVLSIILTKAIGIAGVFLGTVISRLCIYFWYDPFILFKHVFYQPVKFHFIRYSLFGILLIGATGLTHLICNLIIIQNSLLSIIVNGIVCLIVTNSIFLIVFRKTKEFRYLWGIVKQQLIKITLQRLGNGSYNTRPGHNN